MYSMRYLLLKGPTSHLESPVTQEMNRINASARVEFLEHLGHRLRDAAVMRQKQQTAEDSASGDKSKYIRVTAAQMRLTFDEYSAIPRKVFILLN